MDDQEPEEEEEEAGVTPADSSPAAIAAEAERLRILRETMMRRRESEIIREDWREQDGGEE
jgi:hypothetical protein